jgi:hypothetical protein
MKFIFSISLIIISAILFFTIANPLYGDVTQLRGDVALYNAALSNSTDLQKTRDSLLNVYKNIRQEDKDRLEKFLPNTVNNIRFILEIERIANLHNMPIKNIKFDPKKAEVAKPTGQEGVVANTLITSNDPLNSQAYGVFPIEFVTEGDYNTFALFLRDIEHNLRLVDIKSINFIVPDATPVPGVNPNIYTYTLKVETYWLK